MVRYFSVLFLLVGTALAQSPFTLATSGLPNIHGGPNADNQMQGGLYAPIPDISLLKVMTGAGANSGAVGCTSNGTNAACTQASGTPHLSVYDGAGNVIFATSGGTTGTCAPAFAADGSTITADQNTIFRYGPTGTVIWSTALPWTGGGDGCAMVAITTATTNHEATVFGLGVGIATYDTVTGLQLGTTLNPTGTGCTGGGALYISNKEGVATVGNSIYRASQCSASPYSLALLRIDVSGGGPVLGNISTAITMLAAGSQGASTNCEMLSSHVRCFFDTGNSGSGNGGYNSKMQCLVDAGGSGGFTNCSGFPVTVSAITATASAQSITAISSTAGNATFTFASAAAFSSATTAAFTGTGTAIDGITYAINNVNLGANQITVTCGVCTSSVPGSHGAGGTATPSNAAGYHSGFARDTRGCFWMYLVGVPNLYCVDDGSGTGGATDFTVSTGTGFIPQASAAVVGGSIRTMSVNPANSHNLLTMDFNVVGVSNWVALLDMNAGTLVWAHQVPGNVGGQFPLVTYTVGGITYTRMIFANSSVGPHLIGEGGRSQ